LSVLVQGQGVLRPLWGHSELQEGGAEHAFSCQPDAGAARSSKPWRWGGARLLPAGGGQACPCYAFSWNILWASVARELLKRARPRPPRTGSEVLSNYSTRAGHASRRGDALTAPT
jgi:hypothetical protein